MQTSKPAPRETVARSAENPGVTVASPAQRMADESPRVARLREQAAVTQRAGRQNHTGLPDGLKAGIEALSGISLDHVRVHYNSVQPMQLNAHAYAQGSEIHVAPGQERHLPHEAWHVVQQAQGRVRPSRQMKRGVTVNDDEQLEREADVMGAQALARGRHGGAMVAEPHPVPQLASFSQRHAEPGNGGETIQCVSIKQILYGVFAAFAAIALLPTVGLVNDGRGGVARRPLAPLLEARDMAMYGGMDMSRMIEPNNQPNPYNSGLYHESLYFDDLDGGRDYLGMGPRTEENDIIHFDDKTEFYAHPIIEGLDSHLLKAASDIVKQRYLESDVAYEVTDTNCQRFVKDVLAEYRELSQGYSDLAVDETPSVKIGEMWLRLSELSAGDAELLTEVKDALQLDELMAEHGLNNGSGKERLQFLLGEVESRIQKYIPKELLEIVDIKKYKAMAEQEDFETVVGKFLEAVNVALEEVITRKIMEKLPFPGWVSRIFIDTALPRLRDALVYRLGRTIKTVVTAGVQ